MAKKYKCLTQEIAGYTQDIIREIEHWMYMDKHGCNDPFWADGANMNLTRNHIIYDKNRILEICTNEGIDLPPEYYLETPPEVGNNYFANRDNIERVKRIESMNTCSEKLEKHHYDAIQMSLF